jgi:hypothetical protein
MRTSTPPSTKRFSSRTNNIGPYVVLLVQVLVPRDKYIGISWNRSQSMVIYLYLYILHSVCVLTVAATAKTTTHTHSPTHPHDNSSVIRQIALHPHIESHCQKKNDRSLIDTSVAHKKQVSYILSKN